MGHGFDFSEDESEERMDGPVEITVIESDEEDKSDEEQDKADPEVNE